MNRPVTAREALLAEALGDLARLLDRAEAVQLAMRESRKGLAEASARLAHQLAVWEAQVGVLTENAKVQAAKHIAARTEEATRRSIDTQSRAMAEAAQVLFRTEVGPTLQRLAQPLQQLVERLDHPWLKWLTHAATATCAAATTLILTLQFWAR